MVRRMGVVTMVVALVVILAAPTVHARVEGSPTPSSPVDTTEAQPSTTRTTLVPGQAAVTEEGSPQSTTGLVVGLVTVGVIVVGALVLVLRHRGRGSAAN